MISREIDIISVLARFQERVQRLDSELNSIQTDLDKLAMALNHPVAVYEVNGVQIAVTQADVEAVRAQSNRSFSEDTVQLLGLVNKLEAIRKAALVKGIDINEPVDLMQWTLTWGLLVFGYAIVWLVLFIVGFFFSETVTATQGLINESIAVEVIWLTALAGGLGGVVNVLFRLSNIPLKRHFNPRYLYVSNYLGYPIIGFLVGVVIYFIVTLITAVEVSDTDFSSNTLMVYILTSWIAGFRQEDILSLIEVGVQNVFGLNKRKEDSLPKAKNPLD